MGETMKRLSIGVLTLAIIFALFCIGDSLVDYELSVIDRDAPKIDIQPSPRPHRPEPPVRIAPPVQRAAPGTCAVYPACAARQVVLI